MSEFRLYGEPFWFSPYVFSSFVALREKGASFEVTEVALTHGEHLAPAYRDLSITARVPTLVHRDFRLAESSAIAEYLDEVLPPPRFPRPLPAGLKERARARQLMAWLRSDLGALRDERSTVTMFYRFRVGPLTPKGRLDAEKLIAVADRLVPTGEGPVFGDFSLLDAELAFVLHRLILSNDVVPPRLAAYARGPWARPSVREFVEHPRPATIPDSYWEFSGTPRLPLT
jgi:glutathione S-transferase